MGRVRYAKSIRDLERSDASEAMRRDGMESQVRSIRCTYETDSEVAQAVVPKPLEASVGSEVEVVFSSIALPVSAELTIQLTAARFGVRATYDDVPGCFWLTMPIDSEQAVVVGRERYGEPRKLAQIEFERRGDAVSASVERMAIRYLAAHATCVEVLAPRVRQEFGYCFKAFPSCMPGKGFDQDPQLIRLDSHYDDLKVWRLEGELELTDSAFDPVSDLPIRRIVDFEYTEGSVRRSAKVLRPVPGEWLRPFLHQRYDEADTDGVEV